MNNKNNGIGLLSNRVKKTPSTKVSPERYNWLKLEEAEPDLSVPDLSGAFLTSTIHGDRVWTSDIIVDEYGNLVLSNKLFVQNLKFSGNSITTAKFDADLSLETAGTGIIHLARQTKVTGDLVIEDGNITSLESTIGLFNANVDVLNIGGATTTINIGNSSTETIFDGDVTVNGVYTRNEIVTNITEDYIIHLGNNPTPTDGTANGAGIELLGTTLKEFKWYNVTDAWTSSENFDLASGKAYYINGSSILSSTTLGSSVVNSALTSVGTITQGRWQGSSVGAIYGGTGQSTYANGDMLYSNSTNSLAKLAIGAANTVLSSDGTKPVWRSSLTLAGTLAVASDVTITSTTISGSSGTGALVVSGGAGIVGDLYAGSLQDTTIGSIYPKNAFFTSVNADSAVQFTADTSSSSTTTGTLVVTGGIGVSENINIGNNLNVFGSVAVNDTAITIGGVNDLTSNDGKGRGIEFKYYDTVTSATKIGFFGVKNTNSTLKLAFIPDAINTDEVFTGTKGYIDAYIEWNDIQNKPISLLSGGFGTITVTDTDSGYTWSETGSASTTENNKVITFVSGSGIDIDVDTSTTVPAIRVQHSNTSDVVNLSASARTYISGVTFDTFGHVLTYTTATETDVTNIQNDTTTNQTYYPVFATKTTGTESALNVSSTKLTFNPFSGVLTAYDLNTPSDQTLKENISVIADPISVLNQISGVEFNWKNSGEKSFGVIAQELEKVLPDLVQTNDEGIKHVSYLPIIAFLIEAIKQQQKQIDSLK